MSSSERFAGSKAGVDGAAGSLISDEASSETVPDSAAGSDAGSEETASSVPVVVSPSAAVSPVSKALPVRTSVSGSAFWAWTTAAFSASSARYSVRAWV